MGEADDPVTALVLAIEELQAERDEDRALINQLQLTLATTDQPALLDGAGTAYPDWITWVEEWLTTRISRRPQRIRWCHHYADHPETADRLQALWHTWEHQWPNPRQRLPWFRDCLDHQLPAITADDGPLRDCSSTENQHFLGPTLGERRPGRSWL